MDYHQGKTKLLANSEVEGGRIKVVTENGVVYLMGLVTRDEATRATEYGQKNRRRTKSRKDF